MEQELAKIKTIYKAVSKILQFTKEFNDVKELTYNVIAWDAVKMNLVVIYETYLKLNGEVKEKYNSVPWHEIETQKPKLENQFLGFDSDEIWRVVHDRMPEFKKQLKQVIKD